MKKLYIKTGTRDGEIYLEEGKYRTENYKSTHLYHLSATNKEKPCLYDVYELLDKLTMRVLATLTSTGKTKVILVNDNFCEEFEKGVEEIEAYHYQHVVFNMYR